MHSNSLPALALLALGLLAPHPAAAQGSSPAEGASIPPETEAAVEAATGRARAAWGRFLRAARPDGSEVPIHAFRLHANGLRRDGVQTNETDFSYSFLAPDCIRFALADGNETGRSGLKQRDYWKLGKSGVTRLVGRDFAQDRRLVSQMHTLARNFVALTSPDSLHILELRALPAPPSDIWEKLRRQTRKMTWISITSPDFALLLEDPTAPQRESTYRVDIALATEEPSRDLPRYAIIRELPTADHRPGPPLLVSLDLYTDANGIPIPTKILVYAPEQDPTRADANDLGPSPFSPLPIEEIYVLSADLAPGWTQEDFDPGP